MAISPSIVTAIDLSRLPPPQVIEALSFEAILATMLSDFQGRYPDYTALVESDPVMKALEVGAYQILLLRQHFNERAVSMLIAHATEGDLDNLAAFYDVTRLVVTPADPDTGAAAVMEGDDALRRRVLLAPDSFTVAGPASAYIFHALSAAGTIADANATSPEPGHVLVSLLSVNGDGGASDAEIEAVEAVVNADSVRPLTDLVTVASATIIDFDVTATLQLAAGPDASIILAAAHAALSAYLGSRRKIGRLISASGIAGALQVEGVETVILASPSVDIAIGETEAGNAASITVTTA